MGSFGHDIAALLFLLLFATVASAKQFSSLATQATLTLGTTTLSSLSMQSSGSSTVSETSEQAEIQPESFSTFWFKPITNSSMARKQATQTARDLTSDRFELLLRLSSPTTITAITRR
jgi:hypothetical protein